MSFKEIQSEIKPSYNSANSDIVNDFYNKVLSEAIRYDRISGFFNSTSLAIAARGMDKFVKNLEGLAQDKVDEKCIEVCLIVNGKLEQLKKAAVKKLKNRYIKSQKVIQIIEPLTKPPTDLGSVIDYCTGLVSYFTGPYQELISFVSELAPRIVETGQNLQRIASYRPPKVSIKIKTNCLKLIAPSLSLGDILGYPAIGV